MNPKDIAIADYTYLLPQDRIAMFPMRERDSSKLLIYKNGSLREDIYKNIAQYLSANTLLVFNNTRVIQARILFQKRTGTFIEIFCLEPYEQVNEYSSIMSKKEKLRWKCLIGGVNKWKEEFLFKKCMVQGVSIELHARLVEKIPDAYIVEFSWQPGNYTFAEIIEQVGETPLPPYIKRKPADSDKENYQTIYALHEGSVAAPTAGLHFTPALFSSIEAKNISLTYVTLHVGAGTFKPVKSTSLQGHQMHAEWIDVTAASIKKVLQNVASGIITVGTTSVRTLESLYWMGVKSILYPNNKMDELVIRQWDVYEKPLCNTNISASAALSALLWWMEKNNCERIMTQTQILIAPGYQFKIAKAIITNFHQPQSTLLLLVAAAIGEDWRKVYNYALENDFRFLSYGDGSLLYLSGKDKE